MKCLFLGGGGVRWWYERGLPSDFSKLSNKGDGDKWRYWAVLLTSRVFVRRNEDEHLDWRHYRTAWGRQGKSPSNAKTMTAAAWSVEANNGSYRTDGTY